LLNCSTFCRGPLFIWTQCSRGSFPIKSYCRVSQRFNSIDCTSTPGFQMHT